jgi:RHS repeat-associated protein
LYLIEQNLYGSSRLGVKNLAILAQIDTQKLQISDTLRILEERVGAKNYELSNHLGNVLATVSDKTIFNTDHYNGIVYSAQLYYPFGWEIPTLSYTAKKYRFGFNGKEDDREWHAQDYGFRLYTPREARFISVDPITAEYPELTPYQFASNSPIAGIDLDGLEFTAATVNQFTKAMWGVKLIPIDEHDLAEIVVETSVSTAKTVGTFSSFVASGFANAWVYGFKGTKEAKPFDFYDFTDGSWKGWDTNEGRASHDRMLADGVTELGSAAVGSMGGKVVKGISKRLLRGRGGASPISTPSLVAPRVSIADNSAGLAKSSIRPTSNAIRSAFAERVGRGRFYTEVGYQFQKHAFGRTNSSMWANHKIFDITLNPAAYNKMGKNTFKYIWRNGGEFEDTGKFFEKRLPDGKGLRFQHDWKFKGFVD